MGREKTRAVFAIAIVIAVMFLMTTTMVIAAAEEESHAGMVELLPSKSVTFPTRAMPHELIYDDGSAEDAYALNFSGDKFAVRFTPSSYPVDLDTARICLWPEWPDGDHEQFAIEVYDDDGPDGAPGTLLGGPVYYTASDWGWNDVDISGLGITITNGDFYIAYHQLTDLPDCEGLCIDTDAPLYNRSWYYNHTYDVWMSIPYNLMIRCVVDLPVTAGDEIGVFRPGGTWFIDTDYNGVFNPGIDLQLGSFGQQAGDVPVAIDWDGDGKQELAIFRPGGTWFIDTDHNGVFNPGIDLQLGSFGQQAGDVPVAIDCDGDGKQELAIFRPGGTWFIDTNRNGVFNPGIDLQLGPFGQQASDVPVVIDCDGDGWQELAIFRPGGTWFIDTDHNGVFNPGIDLQLGPFGQQAGDVPVVINWA